MVQYPGFKWNEKRSTGVDVAPGLAMEKEIGRESLGEGECSSGKFDETGRPINCGAEFPLREPGDTVGRGESHTQRRAPKHVEGQVGRRGCVKYSTSWCELESGQSMQKLLYFIGERGWWCAKGLNERMIREENVYVTEIVLRIKIP